MNATTYRSKRSRKSAPKSRQGCITCKSRHVKCDEARPFCKRCPKAGRTCEGYTQDTDPPNEQAQKSSLQSTDRSSSTKARSSSLISTSNSSSSNSSLPLDTPIRINNPNALEVRFLEYFYKRSAPSISGYFDTNFYSRILLQAGSSEPAIRHAMMAVAAMHEHFEFSVVPSFVQAQRDSSTGNDKPQFALHQYNKAISAINDQLSSGAGSIETVLMCCLLFVCLECLRGDTTSAVSHLRSGGNIIANWKTRSKSPTPETAYSSVRETTKPTDAGFVNDHLVPIFERLSCHVDGAGRISSSEFADLINPNLTEEKFLSNGFSSIGEARNVLLNLGSIMARLIQGIAFSKYSEQLSEDQMRAVTGLLTKLNKWESSIELLFESFPELRDSRKATVLKVQHRLLIVGTKSCLFLEQASHDTLTDDFEQLLDCAESLVGNPASRVAAQEGEEDLHTFSFEEGVSPACFYTATRCRIPHLRRKAIELLWRSPRRQGIWNSVLLARVAERVMDLEENFKPHTRIQSPPSILKSVGDPAMDPILPIELDTALLGLPLTPESLPPPLLGQSDAVDLDGASVYSEDSFVDSRLPPEAARIHHADIKESTDGTPHTHAVTFYRKPNGLDKAWEIWTESIII